jgi:regulator of nucleoside diphosphate kinase
MEDRTIFITESDFKRLRHLLELGRGCLPGHRQHLELLEQDLDRARVVPWRDLPEHLSIISSQLWVQDLSSRLEALFMLVFPRDADSARGRISVLAPIGAALLGRRVGEVVEVRPLAGPRWLEVKAILPRHEAAEIAA